MTSGHVQELLSPYLDDRVDPEDRERVARHLEGCETCRGELAALQATVAALRALPRVPAPEGLREAIRARVAQAGRSPAGPWAPRTWADRLPRLARTWRPVAAAAAVVVIGLIAANLRDGTRIGRSPGGPQLAHLQDAARERARLKSETATTDSLDRTANGGVASRGPSTPGVVPSPDAAFRSVIRTARLAVEVDAYDAGARHLLDIAEGAGGFIADSSYSEEEGRPRGEFTLRVPAGRFAAAVKDVEALGTVRQRQISAQDVTEEFVDLQARQRNLERHEQQLLGFMDRAAKVSDLLAVEQELSRVRGQIEQITGRLRYLSHNVEMASLNITLAERAKKHAAFWDFGGTLGKMQAAFTAAVVQIFAAAERLLVLAATLLPVAALVAAGWFVIRRTRRAAPGA